MKKFEIVIRGANEEAVAHAVMVGVYGAIVNISTRMFPCKLQRSRKDGSGK